MALDHLKAINKSLIADIFVIQCCVIILFFICIVQEKRDDILKIKGQVILLSEQIEIIKGNNINR